MEIFVRIPAPLIYFAMVDHVFEDIRAVAGLNFTHLFDGFTCHRQIWYSCKHLTTLRLVQVIIQISDRKFPQMQSC